MTEPEFRGRVRAVRLGPDQPPPREPFAVAADRQFLGVRARPDYGGAAANRFCPSARCRPGWGATTRTPGTGRRTRYSTRPT